MKTHALRLSRTKNLHFAIAPFPRFSAIVGVLGDALLNPLTYTFLFAGSGAIFSSIDTGSKAINVSSKANCFGLNFKMAANSDSLTFNGISVASPPKLRRSANELL